MFRVAENLGSYVQPMVGCNVKNKGNFPYYVPLFVVYIVLLGKEPGMRESNRGTIDPSPFFGD